MTTATNYDFQSLVVLPAIRLARLRQAIENITGDRSQTQAILEAVEQHIEVDAYRWGNACSKCHAAVIFENGSPVCPYHGNLGHMAPTELLIAFKPCHPESS